MSNNGPGPLPARWLNCPRRGNLIADKFIPFKTPLDEKFDVPPQNLFTPNMLISAVTGLGKKLGLWIDLTNTKRFYDSKKIEEKGIRYVKLQLRGHGETPSPEQTGAFIKICKDFIERNPNELIGVHCTHGFNRTGFLICAYLIDEFAWDANVAFQSFEASRPPGIYKADYIKELFNRYDDAADAPAAPLLPDWCFEEEDGEDEAPADNPSDWNYKDPRRRREFQKVNAQFMSGVEGVHLATPTQTAHIQQLAQRLSKWNKNGFPGCQPVSMTYHNLGHLHTKPYMVSWKADGTRYMMLIKGKEEIYFIDRDNAVFECKSVTFPKRKFPDQHVENTLVDGEMVIDEVDGVKHSRYLIYDIIHFETNEVGGCDFHTRMRCITKELIEPREAAKQEGRIDRASEPFSIRRKDFWDLSVTHTLFEEKFTRQVGHEIDGLIFQPVPDPYKAGRCPNILKWKPPTHNSIDFKLIIMRENRPGMVGNLVGNLYVGNVNSPTHMGTMKVSKALREFDKKIIECTWDFTKKEWKFMRERTDKSFPNAYDTAQGVWESIMNPITQDILLRFIREKRWQQPNHHHPQQSVKRPQHDPSTMPPPSKVPRVGSGNF